MNVLTEMKILHRDLNNYKQVYYILAIALVFINLLAIYNYLNDISYILNLIFNIPLAIGFYLTRQKIFQLESYIVALFLDNMEEFE
jgi:hypothetical protein